MLSRVGSVSEGGCTEEDVEEGKLDECLARAAGLLDYVRTFTGLDRKLETLVTLLNGT